MMQTRQGTAMLAVVVGSLLCATSASAQSEGDVTPEISILPISTATTESDRSLPDQFHVRTLESVVVRLYRRTIRGEDTVSKRTNDELRRNLRESGLFRAVEYYSGRTGASRADSIVVRDAWSLYPEPFEVVGEDHLGILLHERNLGGSGRSVAVGGDLFASEDQRTRALFRYSDRELLNSTIALDLELIYSEPRIDLSILAHNPFQTDRVPIVYGIDASLFEGEDYFRQGNPGRIGAFERADTVQANSMRGVAWGGLADAEKDLFVGSVALHLDSYTSEDSSAQLRAFENSVGIFAGLRSVRREYHEFNRFDASGQRFEPTGGAGGVSIGKYFAFNGGKDDILYFGAGASQSIMNPGATTGDDPRWFLHFNVEAGTGIRSRETELTMLRVGSSGGLRVGPGTLAFITDLQVAWRWNRYLFSSHQESIVPLRGYGALELFGGNHLSSSLEYRILPGVSIGPWSLSMTLFHDMAGYWNLGSKFSGTRFHHAVGAGMRLGHDDGVSRPLLRIDLPYNVDRGRFDRLEIGLQESFDLFGSLKYQAPGPLQPD